MEEIKMKKIIALTLSALMLVAALAGCGGTASTEANEYTVGICQLMVHESLDKATQGFIDALTADVEAAGKTVKIDTQVAGEASLCTTVINTFTAKNVDLIMANATPALLAAANATTTIPVLGTSVTDYNDTFAGSIPENVSGTSDAVPFEEQAKMMIDSLGLCSAAGSGRPRLDQRGGSIGCRCRHRRCNRPAPHPVGYPLHSGGYPDSADAVFCEPADSGRQVPGGH